MTYTYQYPRPAVTADCVVVTTEDVPKVLLIQRGTEPYKGHWAIPGGFMNMDETAEQCATTSQVHTVANNVGIQFRGCLLQCAEHSCFNL